MTGIATNPPRATPIGGLISTVAVPGTAQTVFAANSIINSARITVNKRAPGSLYVDVVNPAYADVAAADSSVPGPNGTSEEIPPGGTYVCSPSTVAVTVNAAVAGVNFAAISQ